MTTAPFGGPPLGVGPSGAGPFSGYALRVSLSYFLSLIQEGVLLPNNNNIKVTKKSGPRPRRSGAAARVAHHRLPSP